MIKNFIALGYFSSSFSYAQLSRIEEKYKGFYNLTGSVGWARNYQDRSKIDALNQLRSSNTKVLDQINGYGCYCHFGRNHHRHHLNKFGTEPIDDFDALCLQYFKNSFERIENLTHFFEPVKVTVFNCF